MSTQNGPLIDGRIMPSPLGAGQRFPAGASSVAPRRIPTGAAENDHRWNDDAIDNDCTITIILALLF
jgi:hypothetical protein